MLVLIIHVITPLKKAQRTVLFVIKLQIKADLEEAKKKKKKVQRGTGTIFMDSHVSLQISPCLWLCLSISIAYGPK